jgi:microcompartment protein CcmK/EutM
MIFWCGCFWKRSQDNINGRKQGMKLGKVTGQVELKKQAQQLAGENVLLVEMEGNYIAALDKAGAKTGDRVLVVMSHAAGRYSMETPCDAVVVAVVEN